MLPITALLGLILAAWSVRSICIKHQNNFAKVLKSLISAWFFLSIGGLFLKEEHWGSGVVLLLIGAAIQFYCNKKYTPPPSKNEMMSGYADAVKELSDSRNEEAKAYYRSEDFAKGKSASDLKKIAFAYTNADGVSSFRDVDVTEFDGQYIEGYCHLSCSLKTFRLDRIDGDVILRSTGEIMDTYKWATQMGMYFIQ